MAALYHPRSLNAFPGQQPPRDQCHHSHQQPPAVRARAVSWPTRMTQPELPQSTHGNPSTHQTKASSDINTVHVAYRPGVTDRGQLYLVFRTYPGFEMFAFYDHYCFVRFVSQDYARQALLRPSPEGIITLEPAQKNYRVPYPQPEEDNAPCKAIHVTHLPTNYSKEEMCKVFRAFAKFIKVQFHGKYGFVFFEDGHAASTCWRTLRNETNLVISYAKNAKLEEEDALTYHMEKLSMKATNPNQSIGGTTSPVLSSTHEHSSHVIGALSNPMQDFYYVRSKFHGIPSSHFANGLDEPYAFLPRDSIRQLDADIKNDFEQLLLESTCRLCPQPFIRDQGDATQPYIACAEGDACWPENRMTGHMDFEEREATSDLVSPGGLSTTNPAGMLKPDAQPKRMSAPWNPQLENSASTLKVEARNPRSPTEIKPCLSLSGNAEVRSCEMKRQSEPSSKVSLLPRTYYPNPLVPEFLPLNAYTPAPIARRGSLPLHTQDEPDQQHNYYSAINQRQHQPQDLMLEAWQRSSPQYPFPAVLGSYRTPAPQRERDIQTA